MKISTKGRYGLRAMLDLAVFSDGEHVSLSCIAERQRISVNYLEQVFSSLRKAGFVKSIKGAQGGYALTEEPSEISVGSILRALEGELAVVDKRDSGRKSLIQLCLNEFVWERMNDCLNEVVDSITLEDLACDYRRINGLDAIMYHI
ncbi:MAG: Rrf2 family transcriptional regulator [Clostridiaceae bacterium]|jgi:Rrf2 family cysteine metabolism transcriptional repressor|nr:Rrf2 family transcriptional regulator [Clostridiaceae bacterium]